MKALTKTVRINGFEPFFSFHNACEKDFLESTNRLKKWWHIMVSYGLTTNVDFTTVNFFTVVNQGGRKEIGNYLLTIDAAKHIAMVQRNEKGKQDFFLLRNASYSGKRLPLPQKEQ